MTLIPSGTPEKLSALAEQARRSTPGVGWCRWGVSIEQESKQADRVGDINCPVIVGIGGIVTRQREASEQVAKRINHIGDINRPVLVDVSSDEGNSLASVEDSI